MATAALWVASGWLPPAALWVAREPRCIRKEQHGYRKRASLCQDTSGRVFEQLWPAASQGTPSQLSPRTFESRLRVSAPILQDLQQVAAVSQTWSQRIERSGWPAAHAYLYQEPGTKDVLKERYTDSMRALLVKDWLCRADPTVFRPAARSSQPPTSPEGLVSRIVSYVTVPRAK
mmetsp:Transcript_91721/g.163247  ORF Transcript_91721/g.163247 Transcript_91721/m.163247 type:complete len:175 (+) Transcript_91721:40-564(+)